MTEGTAGNRHPGEARLAAYVNGTLSLGELEEVEAHLAICDECRGSALRLREAIDEGAVEVPREMLEQAAPPPPREEQVAPTWTAMTLQALAAAAILAIGLTLWFGSAPEPASFEEQAYRPAGEAVAGPLSPAPGARVDASRLEFRWKPVPGADAYELTVQNIQGSFFTRIRVEADAPFFRWYQSDRPPLPRGDYIYRIRAIRTDRTFEEYRPIAFVVK